MLTKEEEVARAKTYSQRKKQLSSEGWKGLDPSEEMESLVEDLMAREANKRADPSEDSLPWPLPTKGVVAARRGGRGSEAAVQGRPLTLDLPRRVLQESELLQ